MWEKIALELHHGYNSSIMLVIMTTNGILEKCIHGLKHDVIIAPYSLAPTILHEFYDSKGHEGYIHTLEAIRRSYWWPNL